MAEPYPRFDLSIRAGFEREWSYGHSELRAYKKGKRDVECKRAKDVKSTVLRKEYRQVLSDSSVVIFKSCV